MGAYMRARLGLDNNITYLLVDCAGCSKGGRMVVVSTINLTVKSVQYYFSSADDDKGEDDNDEDATAAAAAADHDDEAKMMMIMRTPHHSIQ
jgi:hypothetical protein